jgi:hexulose-6-phosphate isomerase
MGISDVGFMQGRLSPMVDGKIQAFPWTHWRDEFPAAQAINLSLMEWTLDHDRLAENPLMTLSGRAEITALSKKHAVKVGSLTGDIFMQMPFWRVAGAERAQRLREFDAVADACGSLGVRFVVVPLVDNGAMTSPEEEHVVIEEFCRRTDRLNQMNVSVIFEVDYTPRKLASFIDRFPTGTFGVNYDIGNSASLGYKPEEELDAYFPRILNVHVKDRKLGGTTVPLGTGNADLPGTLRGLLERGYRGSYILQTARAADESHSETLAQYRDMVSHWLNLAPSR